MMPAQIENDGGVPRQFFLFQNYKHAARHAQMTEDGQGRFRFFRLELEQEIFPATQEFFEFRADQDLSQLRWQRGARDALAMDGDAADSFATQQRAQMARENFDFR